MEQGDVFCVVGLGNAFLSLIEGFYNTVDVGVRRHLCAREIGIYYLGTSFFIR